MKKNEKGFGAIETLLVLVIVGMVGFVGWYVWNNKAAKTGPSTSTTAVTKTTTTATKVDPNNGYLVIKEWGVRLPSVKSGAFAYSLPSSNSIGSTPELTNGGPADMQYVYVNVAGFTKEQNKCVEKDDSVTGFGSIYRHKEQNPTIQYTTTFQLNPKVQVKIGDWYYSTNGLNEGGNCFEGIPTIPADYSKLVTLFNENFRKLEKY